MDYIVDPLTYNPTAAKVSGLRLLILGNIGSASNIDGADAWKNSNSTDFVAEANDIIEWNGTQWNILFDASANSNTVDLTYITNLNTGIQYKYNGTNWVKSYEGIYIAGKWTLVL